MLEVYSASIIYGTCLYSNLIYIHIYTNIMEYIEILGIITFPSLRNSARKIMEKIFFRIFEKYIVNLLQGNASLSISLEKIRNIFLENLEKYFLDYSPRGIS